MRDGVFIEFEDGKCAVYSAALLRVMLPQADRVDETKWSEQD
jgi:hypothetical protein